MKNSLFGILAIYGTDVVLGKRKKSRIQEGRRTAYSTIV